MSGSLSLRDKIEVAYSIALATGKPVPTAYQDTTRTVTIKIANALQRPVVYLKETTR